MPYLSAEFVAGTVVHVVKRVPGTDETWQMEYQPDPLRPAYRVQRPPTDFNVMLTAITDDRGATIINVSSEPVAAGLPRLRYWAIGWDPLGQRWKRVAFS